MKTLICAGLAAAALVGAAGAAAAQPAERYGHWDSTWGAAPPAPRSAYWRKHNADWYGHVHSCMSHQGYDPARDMYKEGRRWVRCHS